MNRKTVNRNTRVAVTLSPEALKLLNELSEVLEQPKAALVAELVDMALPALQTTLEAARLVKEQPREAQRLMSNFAAQATMDLAQHQLDLDAEIDARTVKGKRAAKKGATRGRTP